MTLFAFYNLQFSSIQKLVWTSFFSFYAVNSLKVIYSHPYNKNKLDRLKINDSPFIFLRTEVAGQIAILVCKIWYDRHTCIPEKYSQDLLTWNRNFRKHKMLEILNAYFDKLPGLPHCRATREVQMWTVLREKFLGAYGLRRSSTFPLPLDSETGGFAWWRPEKYSLNALRDEG